MATIGDIPPLVWAVSFPMDVPESKSGYSSQDDRSRSPGIHHWSSSMITRVAFENFRSHAESAFQLRPINLLIGSVAAGKSNVFKGLLFIQGTINRPLAELFPPGQGEFQWVRSRWADETDPIGFEVEIEGLPDHPGVSATYKLRIADSPNGLYVLEETLQQSDPDGSTRWVFQRRGFQSRIMGEFGKVDPHDSTLLNRVFRRDPRAFIGSDLVEFARRVALTLNQFGYYHLDISELKSIGTDQVSGRIGYYGNRLPDFIGWTKSSEERVHIYEAILADMRELLPELEGIIVTVDQCSSKDSRWLSKGSGVMSPPPI